MRNLLHSLQQSFQKWNVFRKVVLYDDELNPREYDMQAINDRFFKALSKTNRTRTEIAEYLGLDSRIPLALQPKEKIPRPTMESIVKVATFLGVSVGWMLHGIPENDVDLFVDSAPFQSKHSFSAAGSSIVQGNEQSTIIVNNNSFTSNEQEILRIFRSLDVKNQVELLSHAYDLAGGGKYSGQKNMCCPLSQEVEEGS